MNIFMIAVMVLVTAGIGYTENNTYRANFTLLSGIQYGTINEMVLQENGDKLSQLDWDIKPLFYTGAGIDISRKEKTEKNGLITGLQFKAAVPSVIGNMTDRDWSYDNRILSNYSKHENNLVSAYLIDFYSGWSIPLVKGLYTDFYWGFSWMYYSMTARGGYLQYPSNSLDAVTENTPKNDLYGPVVAVEQYYFLLYPGMSITFIPSEYINFSFSIQAGPLSFFMNRDNHYLRKQEFMDIMAGGYYIEPCIKLAINPIKNLSFGTSCIWRNAKGDTGETMTFRTGEGASGEGVTSEEKPGYEINIIDYNISVTVKL